MSHDTGEALGVDNAWRVTTWLLAGLLLVSILANVTLAWRVVTSLTRAAAEVTHNARMAGTPSAPAPLAPVVKVGAAGGPMIGNKDAPVEVIAFLDYACPFCAQFYKDDFGQMQRDYIRTGKVRFVTRDFPLPMHPRARPAAIAADCVRKLSSDATYYRYQDALYESGDLADSALALDAKALGIAGSGFSRCTADADGSIVAKIKKDIADGKAAGVLGTPTFFVNGRPLVGAQPYAAFKAAIDAALKTTEAK